MSYYRVYRYPLAGQRAYKHIYFYGKRPFAEGGREQQEKDVCKLNADAIREVARMQESLSRTKRTVRDLILCNKFDYFCTFTFDKGRVDRTNFGECRKKLTKLFDNYKQRFSPAFRYVVLPEFHADGAIHFHGVVRGIRPEDFTVPEMIPKRVDGVLTMVPNTPGYVDWGYYSSRLGWFSCSAIKNQEYCALYISKYVTKDLVQLPKGARAVMSSAGLSRPELIHDEDYAPQRFKRAFKGEYCEVSYMTEDETIARGVIAPWWSDGDRATLLDDIISKPEIIYEQLRMRDVMKYEQIQ